MGKTTFILQIADQIAQQKQDVLIFSLEMARTELMAKSISRLTIELCEDSKNAKTTRGITTGSKYAKYSCEKILKKFPDCDCHFAGEKPIMLMTGGKVLREYIPNREFSFFEGEFEDIPENVLKYVICCSPEIMNEVREYAKDVCSNDVSIVQSSEFFLEILPKNNSKGNALKKLCSIMSIPVENSVAVGDYENDISMIMTAGLGAAVDNAMPDVKEAADIVLPACEENAVANLIYFLEEMYG